MVLVAGERSDGMGSSDRPSELQEIAKLRIVKIRQSLTPFGYVEIRRDG